MGELTQKYDLKGVLKTNNEKANLKQMMTQLPTEGNNRGSEVDGNLLN